MSTLGSMAVELNLWDHDWVHLVAVSHSPHGPHQDGSHGNEYEGKPTSIE